jgi:TolB-like protein/Flp pilus assembly protein TadD
LKAFFRELKDRSVIKVGLAYLVAAWLVLQIGDVLFPALGLPDSAITLVVGLLILGLPVALALAWAFDITPDGIKRADDADGSVGTESPTTGASATPERRAAASSEVDAATARDLEPAPPSKHPADESSIAVLPFADMSPEGDQEYFCDGLTEELLNVMTRIPDLRVASRTSCFAFKGNDESLPAVARQLGVGHVLEGSVRKAGSRIRVTAQLIEAATDAHLWSDTYDRELDDIFAIQDDISGQILHVLRLKLGDESPADPTTESGKAYEYFLSGLGYKISQANRDLARASELFRRAVDADPEFLRAWVALADVNYTRSQFYGCDDCAEKAIEAGRQAVAIAPDRADSHMAQGLALMAGGDFNSGRRELETSVSLDPDFGRAHHFLARAFYHEARMDEALASFERATDLDPDDYESPILVLGILETRGDAEGVRRMATIGAERVSQHLENYPDNPRAYYLGAATLEIIGPRAKAAEWAARALELDPDDPATRYNVACFYARTGEAEKALDLLEKSIVSRTWIANDPDLRDLHGHPRFESLLERLEE